MVQKMSTISLREIRESLMINKGELAKKTNISQKTNTRIKQGIPFKMETQHNIIGRYRFNNDFVLIF